MRGREEHEVGQVGGRRIGSDGLRFRAWKNQMAKAGGVYGRAATGDRRREGVGGVCACIVMQILF